MSKIYVLIIDFMNIMIMIIIIIIISSICIHFFLLLKYFNSLYYKYEKNKSHMIYAFKMMQTTHSIK